MGATSYAHGAAMSCFMVPRFCGLVASIDALRAFAATTLHDDALVIVAARPPRTEGAGHPAKRGAAR